MPPNFIQFELYKLETICGLVGRETYGCYSVLKYILFNAELQTLYLQRLYFFFEQTFAEASHDSSQYRQVCCLYNYFNREPQKEMKGRVCDTCIGCKSVFLDYVRVKSQDRNLTLLETKPRRWSCHPTSYNLAICIVCIL